MYLIKILKRFNSYDCKPCTTPIEQRLKFDTDKVNEGNKPVKELIGCLMYLMLVSRPDLSFSLNYISRYQDKYTNEVWIHLKKLLRYLKGTIDLELKCTSKGNEQSLICYVDSDWGGDLHDRKSVSGYLIQVFGNTVTWVTRKQNCVALSSTEAELIALCTAVQDCLWFRNSLEEMGIDTKHLKIFEDNQGCIALIKNPENNRRVKHID